MPARVLVLLALMAVVAASSFSGASFTAQTTNPSNQFATAASFCTGSTQTVSANKDSYVNQALPTGNFGTATSISVQSSLLNVVTLLGNRRALVEFALPSVPQFCSVTAATLGLHATAADAGRTIQVFRAAAAWTETAVTWNNQPGTAGTAATGSSGTGARTWDVTAQVQLLYAGTNNGFVLRDATEGALPAVMQTYQSREGSPDTQDPKLTITFG